MMTEGDQTFGGERTVQCTDHVLQNCTLEICIISLINATPINLMKLKNILRRILGKKL